MSEYDLPKHEGGVMERINNAASLKSAVAANNCKHSKCFETAKGCYQEEMPCFEPAAAPVTGVRPNGLSLGRIE